MSSQPQPQLQVYLFMATMKGDVNAFQGVKHSLLRKMRGPGHQTLLHVAATNEQKEIVEWLLNHVQMEANPVDDHRRTPLHLAALTGSIQSLKALLAFPSTKRHALDGKRRTALHVAASNGHLEVVTQLVLAEGSGVVEPGGLCLSTGDEKQRTPLHLAALKGHAEVVRFFLLCKHESYGHYIGLGRCRDFLGFDFFHLAAWKGFSSIIVDNWELLMAMFANDRLYYSQHAGFTPLHLASHAGHLSIAATLLCWKCQTEEFRVAMSSPTALTKQTPLHMVADCGDVVMTKLLLSNREVAATKNDPDIVGRTALHYAARNGHVETTSEMLKTINVDVDARDVSGFTPLHLAAANGHLEVLKVLLKAGANAKLTVNMPSPSMNHFISSLRILELEATSELPAPTVVDSTLCSQTDASDPLHLAKINGHDHIVNHLLAFLSSSSSSSSSAAKEVDSVGSSLPPLVCSLCTSTCLRIDDLKQDNLERISRETNNSLSVDEYNTSFHLAAEVGDAKFIKDKLAGTLSLEVNMRDGSGNSMLHIAAKHGRVRVVELLLSEPNIDVNARDSVSMTPLHLAAKEASIHTLKLLLAHPCIDAMANNDDQQTPFLLAFNKGHLYVCKELLDSRKCDTLDFSWLLRRSVREDRFEMAALLARQEHIGAMQESKKEGLSALDLAMKLPNRRRFIYLLLRREDVQRTLIEKKQSFMDLANSILVGAALIAGVTFQGWTNPPDPVHSSLANSLYWWLDGFAFFMAISSVVAAAVAALPSSHTELMNDVHKAKVSTVCACLLLATSVLCVLGTFASAGCMAMPSNYTLLVEVSLSVGGLLCCILLLTLIMYLARLLQSDTLWKKLSQDHPLKPAAANKMEEAATNQEVHHIPYDQCARLIPQSFAHNALPFDPTILESNISQRFSQTSPPITPLDLSPSAGLVDHRIIHQSFSDHRISQRDPLPRPDYDQNVPIITGSVETSVQVPFDFTRAWNSDVPPFQMDSILKRMNYAGENLNKASRDADIPGAFNFTPNPSPPISM